MKDIIPGQTISHYRITEQLGEPACRQAGGMSNLCLLIKEQLVTPLKKL